MSDIITLTSYSRVYELDVPAEAVRALVASGRRSMTFHAQYRAHQVAADERGTVLTDLRDERDVQAEIVVERNDGIVKVAWIPDVDEAPESMHCWIESNEAYIDNLDCPESVVNV